MSLNEQVKTDLGEIVDEWLATEYLQEDELFVIGCSTSEVAGKKIGTAGTEDIAARIFRELNRLKQETKIQLAFQCCEHLNRALVVERAAAKAFALDEVTVIPVPEAGGSMASFAYKHMDDPVVVESLKAKAHAGLDIGETMIAMHLKPVVVPLRFSKKYIGEARIGLARTRPKLIGGERAVYKDSRSN
ncbi:TIGR01440 family protein [Oceanobacillus alkalisoli]|uniref:TIGR01440 family protein n=1 Tax=Oceanobacillus alkalisoli TaxID=2925113 RepID=UPI001EE4505B|nr:TIGR01440 family protein [Oceanobacillus alkalisoli]MCG5102712.1 TIGR01440 family protein [Oceanobacillus alkalisoli]